MKVKLLRQRHPERDDEYLQQLRALYEGGKAWAALVEHWIPQNHEEPPDLYRDRLRRAVYLNHAGPVTDTTAAFLFAEAPSVDGLTKPAPKPPEGVTAPEPERLPWVDAWLEDVDRRGTPLRQWARERFTDALIGRRAFVWVNLPARDLEQVVESRADEEALGLLDAYLVGLEPEKVIDWGRDAHGRLAWVMVEETIEERASIEQARGIVWRWTYIDAAEIRRWEWSPPPDRQESTPRDDDEATEAPPRLHGLGRLPVVELCLPPALWMLNKLHDVAVAHLRQRNDLSWGLHRAAHALMVIKSRAGADSPTLGPGYYLQLGPDDDVMYAEPSGTSFALMREDLTDLREDLYRVVQQMAVGVDSSASRTRSSGESKALDWKALEIVLSAYADQVRGFLEQVIRLVAHARRDGDAPVAVSGLDGWQSEDLTEFLEAAALAVDAAALSPRFRKVVAKRQSRRLLQDEVPEEELRAIEEEIEAADVSLWVAPSGADDDAE